MRVATGARSAASAIPTPPTCPSSGPAVSCSMAGELSHTGPGQESGRRPRRPPFDVEFAPTWEEAIRPARLAPVLAVLLTASVATAASARTHYGAAGPTVDVADHSLDPVVLTGAEFPTISAGPRRLACSLRLHGDTRTGSHPDLSSRRIDGAIDDTAPAPLSGTCVMPPERPRRCYLIALSARPARRAFGACRARRDDFIRGR